MAKYVCVTECYYDMRVYKEGALYQGEGTPNKHFREVNKDGEIIEPAGVLRDVAEKPLAEQPLAPETMAQAQERVHGPTVLDDGNGPQNLSEAGAMFK